MTSLESFLAMGGYGAFVWPAYALSALVLAGFLWQSLRDLKRHERDLEAVEQSDQIKSRRQARRAARSGETS